MQLDSYSVGLGDRFFHLFLGKGTVIAVRNGSCDVKFDESTMPIVVADNGYISGKKLVFWSNPVLVLPKKDDDLNFIRLREIAANIYSFKHEG